MTRSRLRWTLLAVSLAVAPFAAFPQSRDLSQRPDQTQPLVDQSAPTAAELSAKETVASAFLRSLDDEEYELRSAAEFMPAGKYGYRPAQGDYGGVYPGYAQKSCARSPSRSSTWPAPILRFPRSSTAKRRRRTATRADPAPRRRATSW